MEKKLTLKERLALKNNPIEPLKVIKKEVPAVKKEVRNEVQNVVPKEPKVNIIKEKTQKIPKPIIPPTPKTRKSKESYPGASNGVKQYHYYENEVKRQITLTQDINKLNKYNEFLELLTKFNLARRTYRAMKKDLYVIQGLKNLPDEDIRLIAHREEARKKNLYWPQCRDLFKEIKTLFS